MKKYKDGFKRFFFEKPESFSQWCMFLLRCLFLLVFVLLYIGVCFFNSNSRFVYNMGLALVMGAGLFFALLFISQKMKGAARRRRYVKRLFLRRSLTVFVICMAVLFAAQCRFDIALYHPVGWDVSAITEGANDLGSLYKNDYFSEFPNNLLLVCILHAFLKIYSFFGGSNTWLFLAIVNTAIVDVAIGSVFFIGRRLWGVAAGFISYGIMALLFGFSPWILVPYSDTFSIWVCPVAFLLFLHARDAKRLPVRLALYFSIGLVCMVGYLIKPFTLIILVAIILVTLLESFGSLKRFAAFLLACVMVVSGAGCVYLLDRTQVESRFTNQIDKSKAIPFTHFLMMGLNVQISGATHRALYGAYNAGDYRITLQQKTNQEKIKKNIEVIEKRLKSFGAGGYAAFLAKKANWIFSDGVFWVEGEGDDVDTLSVSNDPVSGLVQSFFRFYGWNFNWFYNAEQGVWTLAIFLVICPLFLRKDDFRDSAVMVARVALLGLLAYLLLFEARSRYLISFLPIVALLAGYGFTLFRRNLDGYGLEKEKTGSEILKD